VTPRINSVYITHVQLCVYIYTIYTMCSEAIFYSIRGNSTPNNGHSSFQVHLGRVLSMIMEQPSIISIKRNKYCLYHIQHCSCVKRSTILVPNEQQKNESKNPPPTPNHQQRAPRRTRRNNASLLSPCLAGHQAGVCSDALATLQTQGGSKQISLQFRQLHHDNLYYW
jgi:hypothetical protein